MEFNVDIASIPSSIVSLQNLIESLNNSIYQHSILGPCNSYIQPDKGSEIHLKTIENTPKSFLIIDDYMDTHCRS